MLHCPSCGSYNLRYARLRTRSERFWRWLGIRPLRCRDCRLRFVARTLRPEEARYARCPRCWRMDLSRWSLEDYRPSAFSRLLLRLGANRWRCEYCRHNFVSFRPRKLEYRPRRGGRGARAWVA